MKWIMVFCMVGLLLSCTDSSAEDFKPQFYPDYFTGLETKNITSYKKAVLDYDLTSSDGKTAHFRSCMDVEAMKDDSIVASEYYLLTMLRLNCQALKAFTHAMDSKKSYLKNIMKGKHIGDLPATAYPYVNDYDRKKRENKKLKNYQKKLNIKHIDDGSIEVETSTDKLIYQVVARGDFNGDGIEDALIRIDWHVIDAFGKGSKLVLLTKRSPTAGYQELRMK